MDYEHILSPDTQATLLLYGRFGEENSEDYSPLTPLEYHKLMLWLDERKMSPSDLLQLETDEQLSKDLPETGLSPDRLKLLLARGGLLALNVERWTNSGIWVISRDDEAYPERLKARLGKSAPPILYGAGEVNLLSAGGLAIVGSRDVDEDGRLFTREVAAECAKLGVQVISGGARGVDGEAMFSALDSGGRVIGVLADSLERKSVSGTSRDAIVDGRLLLVSPSHPNAGFNAGLAMSRNKLIYALSDWALVVNSEFNQGGTWTGARENLKNNWVPLYVRGGDDIPEGNRRLIDLGAQELRIDESNLIRTWLERITDETSSDGQNHEAGQLSIL